MPWRSAPAWPERPPPETVAITSNCPFLSVSMIGWRMIICSTGRPKYSVYSFSFTRMRPEPGFTQTRATAFLRLPVA